MLFVLCLLGKGYAFMFNVLLWGLVLKLCITSILPLLINFPRPQLCIGPDLGGFRGILLWTCTHFWALLLWFSAYTLCLTLIGLTPTCLSACSSDLISLWKPSLNPNSVPTGFSFIFRAFRLAIWKSPPEHMNLVSNCLFLLTVSRVLFFKVGYYFCFLFLAPFLPVFLHL